jgi:hypothetical protein
VSRVSPAKRLFFAFIGLLTGDVALLLYFLLGALRTRAFLLRAHIGIPSAQVPLALEVFFLYAAFSVLGWMIVGVPFALAIPARLLSRLAWPLRFLLGAALGPLALLLIFIVLFARGGHISGFSLAHTETLWPFSILVSLVSFLVYVALLPRVRDVSPSSLS